MRYRPRGYIAVKIEVKLSYSIERGCDMVATEDYLGIGGFEEGA